MAESAAQDPYLSVLPSPEDVRALPCIKSRSNVLHCLQDREGKDGRNSSPRPLLEHVAQPRGCACAPGGRRRRIWECRGAVYKHVCICVCVSARAARACIWISICFWSRSMGPGKVQGVKMELRVKLFEHSWFREK
eukprot:1019051-Pelagomonas_calceolata.AAC.3